MFVVEKGDPVESEREAPVASSSRRRRNHPPSSHPAVFLPLLQSVAQPSCRCATLPPPLLLLLLLLLLLIGPFLCSPSACVCVCPWSHGLLYVHTHTHGPVAPPPQERMGKKSVRVRSFPTGRTSCPSGSWSWCDGSTCAASGQSSRPGRCWPATPGCSSPGGQKVDGQTTQFSQHHFASYVKKIHLAGP